MKDKAFARSVSRDDIINGAADLGVDLEEHIAFCIEAMKAIAPELGLAGKEPVAELSRYPRTSFFTCSTTSPTATSSRVLPARVTTSTMPSTSFLPTLMR